MTQFNWLTEAKFNLTQTKQERFHEVKAQFRSTSHLHEKYIYILLDVLLCSIAEYFYELCRILASP